MHDKKGSCDLNLNVWWGKSISLLNKLNERFHRAVSYSLTSEIMKLLWKKRCQFVFWWDVNSNWLSVRRWSVCQQKHKIRTWLFTTAVTIIGHFSCEPSALEHGSSWRRFQDKTMTHDVWRFKKKKKGNHINVHSGKYRMCETVKVTPSPSYSLFTSCSNPGW